MDDAFMYAEQKGQAAGDYVRSELGATDKIFADLWGGSVKNL